MISNWYAAPKHLESVLAGIWSLTPGSHQSLSAKILPDGTPYIVFQRDGTQLTSSDNDKRAWSSCSVSGPRSTNFDIQLAASSQIYIVQLSSSGGLPVLGLPMSQIADRCEELDNVVDEPNQIQELSDRIMSSSDDAGCIRLLENWIADRMIAHRGDRVDQLVTTIKDRYGSCRVHELAKQTDLSRRQLTRIVKRSVGLTPKLFARIIRFDRAVQLGRVRPKIPLSQIAHQAGYADQAHMNREFVQLGGIRPSDLHKEIGSMIW